MPRYEPRYSYSNYFEWIYSAYRRPGSDYFYKERKDGYFIGTWDFGLISPLDPRFHASTEEHRAYHHGSGKHLYAPASDDPKLAQAAITRATSARSALRRAVQQR